MEALTKFGVVYGVVEEINIKEMFLKLPTVITKYLYVGIYMYVNICESKSYYDTCCTLEFLV